MDTSQIILTILALMATGSGLLIIPLLFCIGRTRIKEIDKVVYGYEFPHDSIFALMIRVPNYGGAFLWKWSAKRSGLEGKIERFDRRFRWPFIAVLLLAFFSILLIIIMLLFEKYIEPALL